MSLDSFRASENEISHESCFGKLLWISRGMGSEMVNETCSLFEFERKKINK